MHGFRGPKPILHLCCAIDLLVLEIFEQFKLLCIPTGANVEAKDSIGNTALLYASHNGHPDVLKALVDAGRIYHTSVLFFWDLQPHVMFRLIHETGLKLRIEGNTNTNIKKKN